MIEKPAHASVLLDSSIDFQICKSKAFCAGLHWCESPDIALGCKIGLSLLPLLTLLILVDGVVLRLEELGHIESHAQQNHRHDVVQDPSHIYRPSSDDKAPHSIKY